MKTRVFLLTLFFSLRCFSQSPSGAFEKVIKEGSSERAFEFVRNAFGLPSMQDPFLHFKERGIRQLISFCSYKERRIEATSLIKFSQVKEFWKNYSSQFTAGKWNYKNLYKTDSLAWEAANYSITLIYAHEMGHYVSYRYVNPESSSYTCEEVLANECLTAFANTFNGIKKFDQHKKLFIELCHQTANAIPGADKTAFALPMEDWCAASPMDNFFQFYEKDETRFLRLYGYLQFKMMEQLLTTSSQSLKPFLARRFTDFNNLKTAKKNFQPLRYRVIKEETFQRAPFTNFLFHKINEGQATLYKSVFYSGNFVHLAEDGGILTSHAEKSNFYPDTTYEYPAYDLESITIWNYGLKGDSLQVLQGLEYIDSIRYTNLLILSAGRAESSFWYLLRRITEQYGSYTYLRDGMNTDSLDKLPSRHSYEFLYLEPQANGRIKYKSFELPDSLENNDKVIYRDIGLAVYNNFGTLLVNNEYLDNNAHRLTFYPVDTAAMVVGAPLWQYQSTDSSFFNVENPSVYIDTLTRDINLAFFNPVTEKIYLIKINDKETKSYVLYNQSAGTAYGPQMKVSALRLTGPRKMYVLAQCRKPGNSSKTETKRLLIQW